MRCSLCGRSLWGERLQTPQWVYFGHLYIGLCISVYNIGNVRADLVCLWCTQLTALWYCPWMSHCASLSLQDDVMFHLLLQDLSQQYKEHSMLTKSTLALTSEEMQVWKKLNDTEEADKLVSKYTFDPKRLYIRMWHCMWGRGNQSYLIWHQYGYCSSVVWFHVMDMY